jgi:hypothetical protein
MLKKTIALIGLTLSLSTNAASLTYVIQGTMEWDDPNSLGGQNFEGSTMEWRITTDTEAVPYDTQPGGGGAIIAKYHYDDAVTESVVTFSNRPNGLNDLTTVTYADGIADFFYIINYRDNAVGRMDTITIGQKYVMTDLMFVRMPIWTRLYFARDFYTDGEVPSPQSFSDEDLIGLYTSSIHDEGYSLTNFSVSSVPIPAAAWLFGSALLGLVAASRRK